MKKLIMTTSAAAMVFAFASSAGAQDINAQQTLDLKSFGDAKNVKLYTYDTAVPAAPALGMVENAPEISFSAPFGADLSGDVIVTGDKPGFAFAARPYWALGFGDEVTLDAYKAEGLPHLLGRILKRTAISGAGAPRVVENEKGLGAALAISTELLDVADPRFNSAHLACLGTAAGGIAASQMEVMLALDLQADKITAAKAEARRILGGQSVPPAVDTATSIRAVQDALPLALREKMRVWVNGQVTEAASEPTLAFNKNVKACFDQAKVAAENRPSFQVAIGTGWSSPDYNISNLDDSGTKGWAAFRIPLKRNPNCLRPSAEVELDPESKNGKPKCLAPLGNLTAFANLSTKDKITVATVEETTETRQAGVVLTHKAASQNWSISASIAWNERDYENPLLPKDKFERYALAYSKKVSNDLWFEATFGQTSGVSTAKDESYGLVRLVVK